MAEFVTPLNRQTLGKMMPGERKVARHLERVLEDDYLVWFDIPLGAKRRYPDFIILHPNRGLLFLEVKDWKLESLQSLNKQSVELITESGLITKPNPFEQVRQCTYTVVKKLQADDQLKQIGGKYAGNLSIPYATGVIFTNIAQKNMLASAPDEGYKDILPEHLTLYKEDLHSSIDAETFQEKLWNMFPYQFGEPLTLPQIDRVRWHLFPEMRISHVQTDLFGDNNEEAENDTTNLEQTLPDIVKIMDIQQEQLARSIGEGHRVIHGVAGSGKTLILGFRCLYLAQLMKKPILVLCFNITLAAKIRAYIAENGIENQVVVSHFHDWCNQQRKTYNIPIVHSEEPKEHFEKIVDTVIQGVEQNKIPRAQYGAVMIDEGHDFEQSWLKLISQMVDPETNSLLLLYDDAQSIYKNNKGLGFTLSSAGIQAKGRTTILKLNYRNTQEILSFAYQFAKDYISPNATDEDHIPLVQPEAGGKQGEKPVFKQKQSLTAEISYIVNCLKKWSQNKTPLSDIAVLYYSKKVGDLLSDALNKADIDHLFMKDKTGKQQYSQNENRVSLLSIHSSKGLEFPYVIIAGVGHIPETDENRTLNDAKLLYVGMTRAQDCLLLTASKDNVFTKQIQTCH